MTHPLASSALAVALTLALHAQGPAAAACDRDCLRGVITQYLDAMVAHNPRALPTAPGVRFTEDTRELPLGEGLWKNASKIRPYRQDFLDVRDGVAAAHVVVEEGGTPVMLALRLKVADRKLTEIETMVTRSRAEGAIFNVEALQTARPGMNVVPSPSQRMSRAEAIRIAEFYPAGLEPGGTFEAVDAPFAADAYRVENGVISAGAGARAGSENIKTQKIMAHPDVSYRIAAVDEEMGVVLMRLDFGDTKSYGPGNALTTFEAFKVYGGQIHAVEAFIRIMPANTPSGWNYEVKRPGAAAAQRAPSPGESVEARLKRFEDKEEIQNLLLDYGRFLDSRDFKSYSNLFAKDGEWVGGFGSVSGPANIQAFMEKNMGTAPNRANNYHLLSNFAIAVTGDTATAWSRWAFVVPGQSGAAISQAGRYDDTLVRENGRWKFKRRVASNDTTAPPPAPVKP